ncbi:uncharacterized protein LOC120351031 [Nilaparvata lugens]|uniref:uncharacterized protein LOC120351031 n=1 Tax=Nilaparvata lugens TaxID=108931 RepID=UPI00193E809F|nr:uncharacterized protein LOC120351031 [Nilaparvata lugens]
MRSQFCVSFVVISLLNSGFSERSVRKKRYVSFPEGSTFTFAFCMTLKAMTYDDIDIFSEAVAVAVNYDLPSNVTQLPFAVLPTGAANIPPTYQAMLPNGAANIPPTNNAMLPNDAANIPPTYQAMLPNGAANIPPTYQAMLPNGAANIPPTHQAMMPSGSANVPPTYQAMLPDGATHIPPTYQLPINDYHQEVYHRYRSARAERALIYQKAETILEKIGMDGKSCVMRSLCEAVHFLPDKQSLIHRIIALIFTLPTDLMKSDESPEIWKYRAAQISGHQLQNCEQLFPRCPISLLALALSLRPGHKLVD